MIDWRVIIDRSITVIHNVLDGEALAVASSIRIESSSGGAIELETAPIVGCLEKLRAAAELAVKQNAELLFFGD